MARGIWVQRFVIFAGLVLVVAACASTEGDGADPTVAQSTTTTQPVTTTVAASATTLSAATVGSDPWGLAAVDLPGTVEEVGVVFEAMPGEVGGYRRIDEPGGGEHLVDYGAEGPSLFVQFGEHRTGQDGEERSPAEWLTMIAESGELDIEGSALTGDVVWLYGSTTVGDESGEWTEYVAMWGEADGECMFVCIAGSQDDLDAVVDAFVDTAGT